MATLATLVFEETRNLTAAVRVNGVVIAQSNPTTATGVPGWDSLSIARHFDSPVPVLSLGVNRIATWMRRGQAVQVELGYNGLTQRRFTGFLQDRSRGVAKGTLRAMGRLYAAFRTIEIPERDVDGLTVAAALEAVLDYVGITDRLIDVPAFTLGTASSPKLERMPCSQQLQALMDIDGCRVWEVGGGVVYIKVVDEQPAPTSFRTYTTTNQPTARILTGSDQEDPDYTRTRVIITGATVVEGAAPNQTSRTIEATATLVGGELVQPTPPAGTYIDAEMSNHLIDTDAKAASVAARVLTKYARVPRTLQLEIAGDPQLELGMTLTLDFPEMDVTGRWFIVGIEDVIGSDGYRTLLTLRGGDELGGTIMLNPIAVFTAHVEREVIGDGVYVVATLDARASYDPDGSIVSYAWEDDQASTPEIATLTTNLVTVRLPASVGAWNVTLTVTDNDGLTDSLTLAIPTDVANPEVITSAIYAALNNNASGSPDGGASWNDVVSANCESVGAMPKTGSDPRGIACFGYPDGSIKRTVDTCASLTTVLAASGANGSILHIAWDENVKNWVWAVTSTGRVLFSPDNGATWSVHTDFGGAFPLRRVRSLAGWGIMVCGGRGDDTTSLLKYNRSLVAGAWVNVNIGGHLATDLVGAASAVTIADMARRDDTEMAIIFQGAALPGGVSVFYTSNVFGDGSGWSRATGLTAGLTTGRFIVPDEVQGTFHCAFGNRDVWHATNGVAYTQTANVLPANGVPWHALWLGQALLIPGMSGLHLVAVQDTVGSTFGLYKSTDGLVTVAALRPATGYPAWPAAAQGKMVALGQPGQVEADILGLFEPNNDGTTDVCKCVAGVWTQQSNIAAAYETLKKLGSYHWAIKQYAQAKRSSDQGVTWADKLNYCYDICIAADGRLWAITREAPGPPFTDWYIYWSDDNGDSWTLAYTYDSTGHAYSTQGLSIAAHPSNANILAVSGYQATNTMIVWTTNRGSSFSIDWGFVTGSANTDSQILVLPNGRYVILTHHLFGGTVYDSIWYADDPAGSWVQVELDTTGISTPNLLLALFKLFAVFKATSSANHVAESTDSAVSWTERDLPPVNIRSGVYLQTVDTMYVGTLTAAAGANALLVHKKVNPSTSDWEWLDVTTNLLTAMSAANARPTNRGLAEL